eukprot:jgi/Picre1/30285/NNA_005649.t1
MGTFVGGNDQLEKVENASLSGLSWLDAFVVNYEKKGVPKNAGVDSEEGFPMKRMHMLMEHLGSPQNGLRCVHVAGTKGKGSTAAFIESILLESGYSVGLYTSPHIMSICERIRVNGENIGASELDALIDSSREQIQRCQDSIINTGDSGLSHFEVMTGLAFRHFRDANVDVAVIEAGLGGARDATNVVDILDAAVITPVGFEHADALGGTIESIALAKSGIMKEGRTSIIGRQENREAEAVVLHQASLKKSPSFRTESIVDYHVQSQTVDGSSLMQHVLFQIPASIASDCFGNGEEDLEIDMALRMVGDHQAANAANAICTAIGLKMNSGYDKISLFRTRGIERTMVPGRFQILEQSEIQGQPLVTVVDGATQKNKDHEGFCREIQKAKPSVVVFTDCLIAGDGTRSAGPGVLAGAWQVAKMTNRIPGWRCRELIQASMKSAIAKARHELSGEANLDNGHPGVILVCGSLHATAAVMH